MKGLLSKIKRGCWLSLSYTIKFAGPVIKQSAAIAMEREINKRLGNK